MTTTDRRTFVKLAGTAAIAPAIAGCSGGEGSSDGGNGDTDDHGDNGASNGGDNGGDVPQEIDDYLSGANEYDGTLADHTGESQVTVEVGGGGGLAFVPAAIRIDAGTTVVFEWTGEGGAHNVVDEDGGFESDLYSDAGETFEHGFEEAGNYRYYCNPHKSSGMRGGIVVE